MKKLSVFLALLLIVLCFPACRQEPSAIEETSEIETTVKTPETFVYDYPWILPRGGGSLKDIKPYEETVSYEMFIPFDIISYLGTDLISFDVVADIARYYFLRDRFELEIQVYYTGIAVQNKLYHKIENGSLAKKQGSDLSHVDGEYYWLYSGDSIEESETVILYGYDDHIHLNYFMWECDGVLFSICAYYPNTFEKYTESSNLYPFFQEDTAIEAVEEFNATVRAYWAEQAAQTDQTTQTAQTE